MADLADIKRKINYGKYVTHIPLGILDVIETDYPARYLLMCENQTPMASLFSPEEWIDILAKSRYSYGYHNHQINLWRKFSV